MPHRKPLWDARLLWLVTLNNLRTHQGVDRVAPTLTILVVDDDTAVRDIIVQIIREKGFQVFAASDGYEAIRIVAERPVDLLFTDIAMPGVDGVQLAMQAKLIRPGIKVLFATGYAQKAKERNAMRLGKVLFKPFRRAELVLEVESLLAA